MVVGLEIRIRLDGVKITKSAISRIKKNMPMMGRQAMQEWGEVLVRDFKLAAEHAGIKNFTGRLQRNGIRWDQRPRGNIGRLFVVQHGIFLDSMRPHWVNITQRRRRLLLWGQQSQDELISDASVQIASGKRKTKAIFVRPHPWMRNGWRRARPKLGPILQKHARRMVKER